MTDSEQQIKANYKERLKDKPQDYLIELRAGILRLIGENSWLYEDFRPELEALNELTKMP